MERTVTFWLIAGCFFFVLWYGVGALLMLIADQPHRAAVRSFSWERARAMACPYEAGSSWPGCSG